MTLSDGYKKVGNRVYKKEKINNVDWVLKFTHDTSVENELGPECGRWTVSEFLMHENKLDQNTETEYDAIKTALNI